MPVPPRKRKMIGLLRAAGDCCPSGTDTETQITKTVDGDLEMRCDMR